MVRPIITIPVSMRRQMQFNWRIEWRGTDPGATIAGNSVWVVNQKPRWVGSPQFSQTKATLGQWQAIIAQLQGRHGILALEMLNHVAMPSLQYRSSGAALLGGETLSTGYGIAYVPTVRAAKSAQKGASVIAITTADFPPVQGQIMSSGDWPFQVAYVNDLGSETYEIGVQMPLRAAIAKGDEIRCVGRGLFEVVDEGQGAASYGVERYATPSVQVQEVLNHG